MKLAIALFITVVSCLLYTSNSFVHSPKRHLLFSKNNGTLQPPITYNLYDSTLGFFGKKSDNNGRGGDLDTPTINGKAVKAKAGEKVSVVAKKAKIPITYSCKKGDCGTCEIIMNGLIVKACQEKIPSGKCVIKTF